MIENLMRKVKTVMKKMELKQKEIIVKRKMVQKIMKVHLGDDDDEEDANSVVQIVCEN